MLKISSLRVVIRTPHRVLLGACASQLSIRDGRGEWVIHPDSPAMLSAIGPGEIVLRKHDGRDLSVSVGCGTVAVLDGEVRCIVTTATVGYDPAMPLAV
jgi:F0F1-type ATP synthase epsilon subunit